MGGKCGETTRDMSCLPELMRAASPVSNLEHRKYLQGVGQRTVVSAQPLARMSTMITFAANNEFFRKRKRAMASVSAQAKHTTS